MSAEMRLDGVVFNHPFLFPHDLGLLHVDARELFLGQEKRHIGHLSEYNGGLNILIPVGWVLTRQLR